MVNKKGRKSKKIKMLELEEFEKNKIISEPFSSFKEKIYELVSIGEKEYYLDKDLGILYDIKINFIGIKKNTEFVIDLDDDIFKINSSIEKDNIIVNEIMGEFILQ